MTRKLKMKSSRGKTLSKTATILLGYTDEGEYILVSGKTRGFNDKRVNKAVAELYQKYNLKIITKKYSLLTSIEKEVYKLRDGENPNKVVFIYDETDPTFIEQKSTIEGIRILLDVVSFFDMDDIAIEDENGKEINFWQDWKLSKKNGLLPIAEFLMDIEKGFGLPEDNIMLIRQEVQLMKEAKMTLGNKALEELNQQEEVLKEVESNELEQA